VIGTAAVFGLAGTATWILTSTTTLTLIEVTGLTDLTGQRVSAATPAIDRLLSRSGNRTKAA
jgi:hypothetical protein